VNDIPELRHAVDRVVVNGGRVFGWGWAAHRSKTVKSVHFRFEGDGWKRRLPAGIGLARDDVEKAYPDYVNSGASGFVVAGHLPKGAARRSWLEIELDEGPPARIDVTSLVDSRFSGQRRYRLIAWVASAIWRRLKRGDILGIIQRAKAQRYAVPSMSDVAVLDQVANELRGAAAVCVLFDHNMGGGANQYRRKVIADRLAAGQTVLLCTYNLPILEYRLHLLRAGRDEQVFGISTFLVLERIIEEGSVTELFVNSPVSFDEPLLLAEWLARMREEHPRVRLTMTAHDYFSVCKSFVLLNAEGRYCGIPEISTCSSCLKRHEASYVALSPPSDIGPWRALWGRCLHAADEVRCFSESTRQHLLRAYPTLARERLTVVPHKPDYAPARLPRTRPGEPLVVGVMGEISLQKGALIVKEILQMIERSNASVRVVVLGTLHAPIKSGRLEVTGAYDRADLVDLVESHGINMFLFPSIWPETFSYVVAEIIALGMPIVAFDLGAPAERLRGYAKARVCGETSASAALATLIAFHRDLAMGHAPSASA
jgi:glycosyltransferase involved in cell wall biosynthesis